MSRRGGRPKRTGTNAIVWHHQNVPQEWSLTSDYRELLERTRVAGVVAVRTAGACCFPECSEPIVSYPHAVPTWEHGVDHPINRAGVCTYHSDAIRSGGNRGYELRLYLQAWLMDWYGARGLPPERWLALASGREPIRNLTRDFDQEVVADAAADG